MPTSKPRKTADGKPVQHKPDNAYTFVYQGKRYKMPINPDASDLVDNHIWMEAFLDSDDPQKNMRLIFAAYKADKGIPQETRDALESMPAEDYVGHLVEWFSAEGEDGVSMGESSSSDEN